MLDTTPDYGLHIQERAAQEEQARQDLNEEAGRVFAALRSLFYTSALRGQMGAPAEWAPLVTAWEKGKDASGRYPRRNPTVGELMQESIEYAGGPTSEDVFKVLSAAAMGQDVGQQARGLLQRMADVWAERNLDEVMA
ncbi:MAG: hypothetical protein Q4A28_06335 [Brachymonas sp.]|nr:hypothetical protein [Brachymonas sp.]